MKQKVYQAVVTVLMLCLATVAQASPPSISGPDTVCVGSYGNYSVVPQPYLSYQWSVTPQGVLTTPVSPYPNATILWGAVGAATITVQEIVDSTGAVWGTLTLNVYVEPLPAPLITANIVVGCQTLNDSIIQNTGKGNNHTQHILSDSGGCVKVCQGSVVTYTAIGSATDTFGWSIVGGTILAQGADTCMVLWGVPGPGTVTVFDTSVWGCTGSQSVCIDIIARPDAHFYAIGDTSSDTVTICMNGSVMFVDNSTASTGSPIVSWFWSFGDGTYSEAGGTAPISHEYTTPGIDTVTLAVKNACGCTDTFSMIVVVNPQTGVTIVCPGVVCQNASATYSLNPTPPCPISQFDSLWTVQGGTLLIDNDSNITVQWNNVDTTGFGYVIFNSAPCTLPCPGVTVIKIPVIQTIGHISGPKVDCDNSQYLYSMPQWPTTVFNWTVSGTGAYLQHDDQNNQIVLNTSGPGTVYLTCNYTNTLLGCGGVAHDTITVLPSDTLTGPAEACLNTAPGPYQVGPGTGLNTNWTLYNPSGTIIDTHTGTNYTTPVLTVVGTYSLTVTPAGTAVYCPIAPYLIKVVGLPPAPDSLLGPDTVCFGSPAIYTAKNPIPGDVFEWAAVTGTCNAAEGNTSSITFTGGSSGTVEVWRVTSDALHCHSDTISMQVYRPVVNLNITGMDTVCPSTAYHYDAGYSQGETYNWTLSNPAFGSVQINGLDTADILFNNSTGLVDIIVEVRKCDTNYFDTLKVYVRPLPTLSISESPNPQCDHAPITVTLNPTSVTGGIEWYWGDGDSTCCSTITSYTYNTLITTNTTYTILVVVTNPYGCAGTISANTTVTILPAPVAYISPAGPFYFCPPTPISQPLTATLTAGFEPTNELEFFQVGTVIPASYCYAPYFPCNPYTATAIGNYFVVAIGNNGCADTSNVVLVDTACSHIVMPCTMNPTPWDVIDTALVSCGSVHLHGSYSTAPGLTALSEFWTYPTQAQGVTMTSTTLDCYFNVAGEYNFTYNVDFADTHGDTCIVTYDTTILVPFIAGIVYSATCGTGGYNVTLMDHSNYFPGYAPTQYSWYKNGAYITTTLSSTYPLLLPAGAYNLGEWVYYAPGDSCWASDSLYLPAIPIAGFTFARDTTCAGQASVQFTNTSTPSSGLTYSWHFGDGASNNTENPYRVYTNPLFSYHDTLTVSNEYGCTSTIIENVPIIKQDLNGTLIGGGTFCAGIPVLLKYHTATGYPDYPDEYYWMEALDTMYVTAYPVDYTYVYSSGSYWVTGTDDYGCYVNTLPAVVNIIQVPPAVISGSHYACLNVPYTLNGWVGDDPNVSYKWYKNNVLDGTGSSGTDPAAYVTSVPDTFMLVVFINYSGDTCSDTSAKFWVQVYPQPPAPTINATIISCATYTFSLSATPASVGYYNWSDGLSGQTITVTGGGPYGVWYTDTFGCTSFGSTYIDQDPTQYLWIFPTGCYTWCSNQTPTPYIVGPIIPFTFWKYQYAPVGPGVDSGYYYVYPWYPPGSGDYDLILENQYCSDTSGILDITIDSNCSGCQCLKETISSYSVQCENPPGCCQYYISMCFDNSCYVIQASVTTASGTLTPGAFTIPLGYTCDTLQFTPYTGFTGGWVYIHTIWTDGSMRYNCEDSVYIPLCNPGDRQSNNSQQPVGSPMLDLVPNPAQNSTRIDYMLDPKQTVGSIEVYDMMGRLVSSYLVSSNSGSLQLSLDNYAAGVYMVMLKEGDIIVKESKLSVLR